MDGNSNNPKATGIEAELSSEQLKLLHRLANKVVQMRMTTPAILFLESVRPLNYVGSQVMVFFAPVVQIVFSSPEWDQLQQVLEKRESLGYIVDLIEAKESDYLIEPKKRKDEARGERAEPKISVMQRIIKRFK